MRQDNQWPIDQRTNPQSVVTNTNCNTTDNHVHGNKIPNKCVNSLANTSKYIPTESHELYSRSDTNKSFILDIILIATRVYDRQPRPR
jgi:hypothetical protein